MLLKTLSCLVPYSSVRQTLAIFFCSWILRLYQSSGKEKESHCLAITYPTKREIRTFHVEVEQRRRRNVQESVMHVQSCSFALPFSLTTPSSLLKLPDTLFYTVCDYAKRGIWCSLQSGLFKTLVWEREQRIFLLRDAVRKIDRHDHRLSKIVNITALLFHAAREKNWLVKPEELNPY